MNVIQACLRINRTHLIEYLVKYENLSSGESRDYRECVLLAEQLCFCSQCSEQSMKHTVHPIIGFF